MHTTRLSHLFLMDFTVNRVHGVCLCSGSVCRDLAPLDAYTLILCRDGALSVETDVDSYMLSCGDALVVSPSVHIHIEDPYASAALIRFSLSDVAGEPILLEDISSVVAVDTELMSRLEELCYLYQKGVDAHELSAMGHAVLYRISRAAIQSTVLPALDYVHAHLCEDVRVDHLAALCDMCESSLRREFSAAIGMSPKSYILQKKLSLASRMLASGLYAIKEICDLLGFYDDAYFSKLFKRHTGMTPMQYSKGARAE